MGREMTTHTAYCIVRFAKGKFERVREGYKSAENAIRGIPSAAREYLEESGDKNATYTIGKYTIGGVITQGSFRRYSA